MAVDLPNAYTVLTLTGMGVAPYSARGLTQSLTPISAALHMRRTINGTLVDLGQAQFRKYRSTISGTDQKSPTVGGIWPGALLTVECIAELAVSGGSADRPAVTGSTYTDGGVTYYRPVLQMRVVGFSLDQDEYGAQVSWSLELEEV